MCCIFHCHKRKGGKKQQQIVFGLPTNLKQVKYAVFVLENNVCVCVSVRLIFSNVFLPLYTFPPCTHLLFYNMLQKHTHTHTHTNITQEHSIWMQGCVCAPTHNTPSRSISYIPPEKERNI
mmetsp:Transcript_4720/g.6915  ORF Transcript_4720/g.6915 Transcript_4720/m.6915 type:complete len:121 (-) Transcript_4720:2722-3084(-)